MKFTVDENLPLALADLLRQAGHNAIALAEHHEAGERDALLIRSCQQDQSILVTLDVDFADIRSYPPSDYPGIIVFRVNRLDKPYLVYLFERVIALLLQEPIEKRLWVIEETQVRIRE